MKIIRSDQGDDYATLSEEAASKKQLDHAHALGISRYKAQSQRYDFPELRASVTLPCRIVPDDDEMDDQQLIK